METALHFAIPRDSAALLGDFPSQKKLLLQKFPLSGQLPGLIKTKFCEATTGEK